MIEAPSCDASGPRSRAHEGLPADTRSTKSRAYAALVLWHRLAFAVVAVIFCAGVAVPGWRSARPIAAAIDAAVRDTASAERVALQSEQLQRWRDDGARFEVDHTAIESDGDGDEPLCDKAIESDGDGDEPLCDLTHGAARSLPCIPLQRKADRALRGELPIDTSHFAAGPRLPRGPPACGT